MFENEWIQKTLLWIGGIATTAFGWFAKRQLDRIDFLEKNSVTRPEFIRALDNLKEERNLMHEQNQTVLNRIDARIDTILLNTTVKEDE